MKLTSDTSSVQCIGGGGGAGGEKMWPPGFRFHPTDEELILFYLKRKICRKKIKPDIITETDVYKWDPEELPGLSIWKTGDRQWFFFSPRDRKYPNGARSSRATRHGYWKATGKDRCISCNSRSVGVKKTLVFYKGRAPNGVRTDWVMHEYTLDEEEFRRLQNVQEYYALYKVYKKSGAGPKNGEQYGAPFNEEEWVDDDYVDFNNSCKVIPLKQLDEVPLADNLIDNGQIQSPLNDFEEFMSQVANDPAFDLDQVTQSYGIPQVVDLEETQSTLLDPSFKDVVIPEPIRTLQQSGQHFDVQRSFDFTQSATSHLQHYEATEVTSAPNPWEQEIHLSEDFLEIDDLLGPEPIISNIENAVDDLQFEDIDGLSEFDLFHEAAMFLRDMGPIDHEAESQSYINSFQNNITYNMDYQSQTHPIVVDEISSQLWMNDQKSDLYISSDPNQGEISRPTSGVIYESTQTNQTRSTKESGNATTSRFSSALWSFVESIPSNPASAAENALVSRAFERMSSFSRLKLTARTTTVAGNDSATITRADRNKGFILFSLLGALCAILWVLMGMMS